MLDQNLITIVRKAMQGDEKAFADLCERKGRDILYFSIKLMGNRQDGEDAAQEVLIQMQQKLSGLRNPEAFHLWMYRIINSVCMNLRRKNKWGKVQRSYEEDDMDLKEERKDFLPYDFAVDEEKRKQLLEIIDELPYRNKMCVLLFYYQNMKYEEISEILNITKKDVSNALYLSKRTIKKAMQKEDKSLKTMYVMGPVPVLTHVLLNEIGELVTNDAVQEMLAISPVVKISAAGVAAKGVFGQSGTVSEGAAGSVGSSGTAASAGMSAAVKATIGIVVSIGIAVGGMAYINRNTADETDQNSSSVSDGHSEIPPDEANEQIEMDEDFDIKVLEDMIGDEAAVQLKAFSGLESGNYEEIHEFLEEQGMVVEESVYKLGAREEYTLYTLQKQKKLLMVIVKQSEGQQVCKLNFQFTNAESKVPRAAEIWKYNENW